MLKDSWNSLSPVPVSGNAVGDGVQETDDGIKAFLPGDSAGLNSMHRMQGGDGNRATDVSHADTAWEGSRWDTELGIHVPR